MKQSKRLQIKLLHAKLIKSGKFGVAEKIYRLLLRRSVTLGLSDDDWNAQNELENIGCFVWFSSNGIRAIAYDYGR